MDEVTRMEMREKLEYVDKIRDLIVGTKLREYDQRFDKIAADISLLEQRIFDRDAQLRISLSVEVSAAIDALEKKFKLSYSNSQEETIELRRQIESAQLRLRITDQLAQSLVDLQPFATWCNQRHANRRMVKDCTKPFFTLSQQLFCILSHESKILRRLFRQVTTSFG